MEKLKFTLYWLDGTREIVEGFDISDAVHNAGYSRGAISALDFYADGDDSNYHWDTPTHNWVRNTPLIATAV